MSNPGLKQTMINFPDNDTSKFGLTPNEFAVGINKTNIGTIKNILLELVNEGILIETSHKTSNEKRYKTQKTGQDLLGN